MMVFPKVLLIINWSGNVCSCDAEVEVMAATIKGKFCIADGANTADSLDFVRIRVVGRET